MMADAIITGQKFLIISLSGIIMRRIVFLPLLRTSGYKKKILIRLDFIPAQYNEKSVFLPEHIAEN